MLKVPDDPWLMLCSKLEHGYLGPHCRCQMDHRLQCLRGLIVDMWFLRRPTISFLPTRTTAALGSEADYSPSTYPISRGHFSLKQSTWRNQMGYGFSECGNNRP